MPPRRLLLLLLVGLLLLVVAPVIAQNAAEGPALGLSKRLYCYAYTLFASRVGLFIGLCIGITGLWTILTSEAWKTGLVFILTGALISALTTVIESAYSGLSGLLVSGGMSNAGFTSVNGGFLSLGVGNDITQCDQIYVAPPPPDPVVTTNANGTTNNPANGTGSQTPLGTGNTAPVNSQCVAGQSCPLGIRNNNPGNIRALDGVTYPGQIGTNKGFAVFDSMENGIAQMEKQLQRYGDVYGKTTIGDQINRWAPPTENQTSAYVNNVVSRMRQDGFDVSANSTVNMNDAAFRRSYLDAMIMQETGRRVR